MMKKFVSVFFLTLFLISCATTAPSKKADQYANLTVKNVTQNCQSTESWQMNVLGTPSLVLTFENCLKINELLVISVPAEIYTRRIRETSVTLLAIHYVEFLKSKNTLNENEHIVWSLKKIKEETSDGGNTHFYLLTFKKHVCDGKTCSLSNE